jgi:crossover junction endodeoxyribonuclease RuvC
MNDYKEKTIRILGIDPGSQITGFGIIEQKRGMPQYVSSGCIRVGKFTWTERLHHIFDGLSQVVSEYSPEVVVIERIFVHKNVSSALKLGQVRGVALLVAALKGLSVAEYTARQIKKAAVGYGAAEKNQVQHMMQSLLKLTGKPQADAADALAAAFCHSQDLRGLLGS